MRGRKEEAEVIIRLDQLDGLCYINVSMWPAMARKMEKRYGPSLDARRGGDSLRWKVPLKAITFRSLSAVAPPRKRIILAPKHRRKGQFGDATARSGPKGHANLSPASNPRLGANP